MSKGTNRPNILFIMADQHRADYLGAAGANFVRTPNLDRIAASGMRFDRCFTNAPLCAPARIALATGMQPIRMGALDNDSFLPASATTYYQRLRDHGYRVGCVGKVDLAKPDTWNGRRGDRPCMFTFGFTHPVECEGKMHAGMHPEPRGPYGLWLQQRGLYEKFRQDYDARAKAGWVKGVSHDSVLPTEAFEDIYIGRRAVEWIENVCDDFPWHLFVGFAGPHDPFDPPSEYAKRFGQAEVPPATPATTDGKPKWVQERNLQLTPEEVAHTRRQYCASIQTIDDSVGRIVAALQQRGLLADTYIIFSSDHGEMLGDHGIYTKSVAYEAALRVPLLVAGPGIEAAQSSQALIELIDLNPTICRLAGLPAQENIDARSFVPILRGQAKTHRDDVISTLEHFCCIRTERYKLVDNYNDIVELYDLQQDGDELHNIAEKDPEFTLQLRQHLRARCMEGAWRR